MSQLACAGLGSARDHANAVLKLQSADGSSPYAQPSPIRAALIGACQAVWLLPPDERAVRMKRFRVVLRESQSRHDQFLRGHLEHPVAVPYQVHESSKLCAQRLSQIETWRERHDEAGKLDTARSVEDAARFTFSPPGVKGVDRAHIDRNGLVVDMMLVWRTTSGSAHGLPWSIFHHPGTQLSGQTDEFGVGEITSAGDVGRIVWPLHAVTIITQVGFALLDKRGATNDGSMR